MHPIDDHRLPGIGPMRLARLQEAGVQTLEDLLTADQAALAGLPGLNAAVVASAVSAASHLLATPREPELPEVPDVPGVPQAPAEPEPPPRPAIPVHELPDADEASAPKKLKRGLDTARRVETTLDWVRQARAHARTDPDAGRESKELRRQLKRLRGVLERLQKECITHGLSRRAAHDLGPLLDEADARLSSWTAKSASEKRADKAAQRVRAVRRGLAARLG
ncbi:MAG: helix-hairpin-helix domain-containing protein [Alphaproteobacteria bacterium]|nr:helix-hairpin-helix domain-containing protein [Alphaproteobacteria bacterium]